MDIRSRLSERIGLADIQAILSEVQADIACRQELYDLLFDGDELLAYQSAWVMTHFARRESEWLCAKQDELIDEVMLCSHTGKRRLLLSLLFKQVLTEPLRVDFLNFCLDRMLSVEEPSGVQSLCMKLAYELCHQTPELKKELRLILEMMDGDLSPAICSARKNVLKAMQSGRSMHCGYDRI